jgi:hypothetical protein
MIGPTVYVGADEGCRYEFPLEVVEPDLECAEGARWVAIDDPLGTEPDRLLGCRKGLRLALTFLDELVLLFDSSSSFVPCPSSADAKYKEPIDGNLCFVSSSIIFAMFFSSSRG